ncbi:hypothetical protein CYMTET_9907 [Cymbomonas tetramitiformis]|uniref:Uncharacterized protein n=1 Tax=Cymbomonas tetramitiformis TaxID=36881 RepID=A0AAE0LF05_9CHLO|nr:hypothetical protein CYMTET_9907 [Cymbomonas tetramitiformis]
MHPPLVFPHDFGLPSVNAKRDYYFALRSTMATVLDSVDSVEKIFDFDLIAYADFNYDVNAIAFTMLLV